MSDTPKRPRSREKPGLNARRKAFCAEYIIDLNATQAAIRAGYSEATARQIGQQNLSKLDIQNEVQRLMAERSARVEISADRVLQELKAMAFYDPGEIAAADIRSPADVAKLPAELRRAIIGWSYDRGGNFTLKLAAKTPQLEMLGRHLKMFTDRHEHTGADGGPIQAEIAGINNRAHSISGRVKDLREQIQDPEQRKALLESLPEEVRDDAKAADRIAEIRRKVLEEQRDRRKDAAGQA